MAFRESSIELFSEKKKVALLYASTFFCSALYIFGRRFNAWLMRK